MIENIKKNNTDNIDALANQLGRTHIDDTTHLSANEILNAIKKTRPPIKKSNRQEKGEASPIEISYRDEARGGGAFYDHYTVQQITGRNTVISSSPTMSTNDLKDYIEKIWRGSKGKIRLKHVPVTNKTILSSGLLFIPGRARRTEEKRNDIHILRTKHEQSLIREAKKRGKPILAVCAGSWQLWQAFGGKMKEVSDHSFSRMPSISLKTGYINFNQQMHRVQLEENTILAGSMFKKEAAKVSQLPSVNSVHWCAPDEKEVPDALEINARTRKSGEITLKNRRGHQMNPEGNTIEGFETKHGAPMLGIQWHPEAYYGDGEIQKKDLGKKFQQQTLKKQFMDNHYNILLFMASAGDTFMTKQRVIKEFKDTVASVDSADGTLRQPVFK